MKHATTPSSSSSSSSRHLDSAKNGAVAGTKAKSDHVVNSIEGGAAGSTTTSTNTAAVTANGLNSSAAVQNGVKTANGDDRNDSEADTEIESGKEAGTKASSRKIKHNGNRNGASTQNGHSRRNGEARKSSDVEPDKPPNSVSGKDAENSNSSILTSAVSSPSNEQYSRPGSETAPHSPSKTSVDSDSTKIGKRKRDAEDQENGTKQRKVKREDSPTASSTRNRSDSPPSRRKRTLSTQSNSTPNQHSSHPRGRRAKPPPIHTKTIHDNDSEDSSTSHHQSHHRKSASLQHSSRKMPAGVNTAKYRDRNGRTFLAKACAGSDVEAVRERYFENPEHLDVKEYAENSPLQIASLEGREEIVKFLVDQGANVNTQNDARDTPLIDAVENGHLGVVRILLDAGANPSQPNAKGEEPLELIPEDSSESDAIRTILLEAKEKYKFRRPSEPTEQQQQQQQQQQQPASSKARSSVPIPSPKGSPSFQQNRFGADMGRNRRAQRGQANKRDDLLWIPATAARLQQAAGEGDAQATNHILSMGTAVDSESVLAAAKGCHEDCLSLLMAFGAPEVADPDPIPGLKNGWDTPLLATIGQSGDNLNIIRILLGQPGFDPTRRLFQDKAYFEIARERAGPHADEEATILEEAYDEYVKENASPRKKKKSQQQAQSAPTPAADSGSPRSVRIEKDQQQKDQQQQQRKDTGEAKNKQAPPDGKSRRRASPDRPLSSNSRLPALKHKSRESSVAVSDREREPASPSRRDKRRRISSSSEEEDEKVIRKQRRRLLTGKERREGAERKRRSSITSLDTPRSKLQEEAKKARASMSPARDNDKSSIERKASDPVNSQRVKRQRSELQQQHSSAGNAKSGKEKPLEKNAQPLPASQKPKSATSSPPKAAEIKTEPKSDVKADVDIEKRSKKREDEAATTATANEEKEREQREQRRKEKERQDLEEKRAEEKRAEEKRAEEKRAEEKRVEERKAEERKAEERKAEERKAEERKAEEKRAEERKAEEERKSAAAAEAKRVEEEKRQEEERRQKLEAEEAARKKEEAARRAEEERRRQEAEAAAAEAARAKEMERQRNQKRLPEAVYAAFYKHQSPPTADELEDWRNLRLVTSDVLVENGVLQRSATATDEADWVLNMQVAVLLGTKSLELSSHSTLASCEKVTLPGKLGLKCSAWWPHTITSMQTPNESYSDYQARVTQDRQKMAALARENELFFIRRSAFDEAVSQSPHLKDFQLRPSYFAFARFGSA